WPGLPRKTSCSATALAPASTPWCSRPATGREWMRSCRMPRRRTAPTARRSRAGANPSSPGCISAGTAWRRPVCCARFRARRRASLAPSPNDTDSSGGTVLHRLRLTSMHCLALLIVLAVVAAALDARADEPVIAKGGDWRVAVRTFAQQHLRHPAWGASHSQRDYDLARSLAAADHVALDDDVLYAAAFLHDVAAFAPWQKHGVDHADRAV